MIPKKTLVILAVLEGAVMTSAILRLAVPGGGLDLGQQPQLIWFVAVMVLSAAGLSQYVLRVSLLQARIKAGEDVEDERRQSFIISIALIVGAGLLSLAGPDAVQRLLG